MDTATSQLYQKTVVATHVIGADGGGSRCRQALSGLLKNEAKDVCMPLGYGYKEATMPLLPDGSPPIDKDSLHIWPRGSHFMMGLANRDGSFTMTIYMPNKDKDVAFDKYKTPEAVQSLFEEYYADAASIMPAYKEEFVKNPVGFLGTVFCEPWVYEDKFALIGDAAHAITPFFGQGCNSGFEDVMDFHEILEEFEKKAEADGKAVNMKEFFAAYYKRRKINGDAIANMALENFTEMMDKTSDKRFLIEKEIENRLSEMDPSFKSRYVLITHSLLQYHLCLEAGKVQQEILSSLSENLTEASSLDEAKARSLLDEKWAPFLKRNAILPADCHFTCKYY